MKVAEAADKVLARLCNSGMVSGGPELDWQPFQELRSLVRARFTVPATSITPLMARVLYGIAALVRPRVIVAAGTYYGNALVWLTGPARANLYDLDHVMAVDPDAEASEGCRRNFAAIGMSAVEVVTADARDAFRGLTDDVDLLFLDAEDAVAGKGVYLELAQTVHARLASGAFSLAHDVCVPKFHDAVAPYMSWVRDPARFARTATLAIDYCGLEVSRR